MEKSFWIYSHFALFLHPIAPQPAPWRWHPLPVPRSVGALSLCHLPLYILILYFFYITYIIKNIYFKILLSQFKELGKLLRKLSINEFPLISLHCMSTIRLRWGPAWLEDTLASQAPVVATPGGPQATVCAPSLRHQPRHKDLGLYPPSPGVSIPPHGVSVIFDCRNTTEIRGFRGVFHFAEAPYFHGKQTRLCSGATTKNALHFLLRKC